MLPDNRLTPVAAVDEDFARMIIKCRSDYEHIDSNLRDLSALVEADKEGVMRCISTARTHLEMASMYTVKALCLMGEINPEQIESPND